MTGGLFIQLVPEFGLLVIVTSSNFESLQPHVIVGLLRHIVPGAIEIE